MREWTPVVEGELARDCDRMVDDIAAALAAVDPTCTDLAGGALGVAVFYSYLATCRDDDEASARAAALLEQASDRAAKEMRAPSLFGGFAGLGWTLDHLVAAEDDDPVRSIDASLLAAVDRPWVGEYDLINGLVGLAVFALDRLPRPPARRSLELVVEHLSALAERGPDGITWFTSPETMVPLQRTWAPRGFYNLGMAHGMPSILAVLARIAEADVRRDLSLELLDGGVRWLTARRGPAGYPYWIADGESDEGRARCAWCYGDLGIAVALLAAARATGSVAWEEHALELALGVARRPAEESGVVDATLCHGSLGVAHALARFHHATGERELHAAAVRWIEHALGSRRAGADLAGLPMWDGQRQIYAPDPGLLTGVAGMGLALLAATSMVEPAWDRLFLLDLAPARV